MKSDDATTHKISPAQTDRCPPIKYKGVGYMNMHRRVTYEYWVTAVGG